MGHKWVGRSKNQLWSTCVQEGSRVPNLQTEFNYLDSFKSYGIFSDFVVPVVSTLSPWSLCHPRVIPMSSPSLPCHPHSPQKVPMWSPRSVVSVVSTCCPRGLRGLHMLSPWSPRRPRGPHIVPVVPTSSPWFTHCLKGSHIIPDPPYTHSTHPHPPGGWGPQISKNTIRFELIKIF